MISLQDVTDFIEAKRCGDLARAEDLLRRLVDADEVQAQAQGRGVAPWYYEELAILYRKQKRYDAEIEVLQRFAMAIKGAVVAPFRLAIRLEDALLFKEEGRNGPKVRDLRAKRARTSVVTIDTDLGRVTIKNPYHGSLAIIASGQSAEHLEWYYNVYRKEELERAVGHLNQYLQGEKQRSNWNDTYFKFMQKAPTLLADLPNKLETTLRENKAKIDRKEVQVLGGPWDFTRQRAERIATELSLNFKATLNAGWLNVQVVVIPEVSED
jgi:hypothetical protein